MIYLFDGGFDGSLYKPIADVYVRWVKGKGWMPKVNPTHQDVILACTKAYIPARGRVVRLIGDAGNKPYMRKLFVQHGVPTIKTWDTLEEAVMPFVARPQHHLKCDNFYIIRTKNDLKKLAGKNTKNWYYSEVIPVEKEYRVLVFCGHVFAATEKKVFATLEETIKFRKENRPGSEARRPSLEILTDDANEICVAAANAVSIDFGGVDLFISNGKYVVCEINSVPMPQLCGSRDMFNSYFKTQIEEWAA